jgi:hypothetical protein
METGGRFPNSEGEEFYSPVQHALAGAAAALLEIGRFIANEVPKVTLARM